MENVMTRYNRRAAVVAAGLVAFPLTYAHAETFSARMTGFKETPAIFSAGSGTFQLDLDTNANTARYTLTYSGLSSPVTQGHIHLSKKHVAGGIIVCYAKPRQIRDRQEPRPVRQVTER